MKLGSNPHFWLILRLGLIALITWGLVTDPRQDQFTSWTAAWLVPPFVGAVIYFMISQVGWHRRTDLSEPMTFTKPFWPITTYPTRFFALNACAAVLSGCVVIVREIGAGEAITPFSIIELGTGLAVFAAIWVAGLMIDKSYH